MVFTVKAPPKELDTEDIDFAWKHFTDFNNWHKWNSFVKDVHLDGPVQVGTTFVMDVCMFNRMTKTKEIFASIDHEEHSIEWKYNEPQYKGISGHRINSFKRDSSTNKVVLHSQESFSGYLSWIIQLFMYGELEKQFKKMNEDFNEYLNSLK